MRAIRANLAPGILAAAVTLAACSSGSNLPSPGPLPANPHAVELNRLWSRNVGGGGGNQLLGLAPDVVNGEVVAAGTGGDVAAYDIATGKELWRQHVKGGRLSGGPAIGHDLVVVGTRRGYAVALDAKTGAPKWSHYVGAPVLTSPAVGAAVVAVKTIGGSLVGLSPQSGDELWVANEAVPSLTLRFDTRPLVADGVVYAGFADGKVAAFDAQTGKELWREQVAQGKGDNLVADIVNVGGLMALSGGDLYVATYQGRLVALDASSGQVLWGHDISSYTGVGIDAVRLYVSDSNGLVHAFDLITGVPDWTYNKLTFRDLSAAVPFGSIVVVGDHSGRLHLLDRDKGKYLGRIQVSDGAIRMPPVVAGDRLVVLAGDGTLAAYALPAAASSGGTAQ
ncbi:MAG TPA: outer membrane protein assembly factor BamB [Thermomicrobiales bacterium]|nr:outer membrane protein assembly factor BamB [Thermomicrobiales bacterium]